MFEITAAGIKPMKGVLVAYSLGKQHGENGTAAWRGGDPVLERAYEVGYESGQRAAANLGKSMGDVE